MTELLLSLYVDIKKKTKNKDKLFIFKWAVKYLVVIRIVRFANRHLSK
jgi:hypothetical protein